MALDFSKIGGPRPRSPSSSHPAPAAAHDHPQPHEAASGNAAEHEPAAAHALSALGLKADANTMDPPPSPMFIDISGPSHSSLDDHEAQTDLDSTVRNSGESPDEVDITAAHDRSWDDGEIENGTGMGAGAGAGEDEHRLERVHEHPLRLDVHPPSPSPTPSWDVARPGDPDDSTDGGHTRGEPQRYALSTLKSRQMHDYGSKGRSHRPKIPQSSYFFGAPPSDSAFGSEPIGQIGVHHPREVVRIERDYTGGELVQFTPTYPLELEGRISPTQFLETINAMNEVLISAHSLRHSFLDNSLAFFSLQISRLVLKPHYDKEMERLHALINELNTEIYNPVGLNIRWPHSVAFLFLEIEYY